ncbi:hypothetical protein JRI60_35505 [Archangium violaceum]|uniref:hypothetical protein n=1 Tax=Archangium violaceum TaxID=83451 RepID=UPI0019526706|nr:hypothetical protein [Archangium violaceum]QRN94412.1 hypothetical protein JRI60_35505 [Archangium violaceum]
MSRQMRIALQVFALGMGVAFGFGAQQAAAKSSEAQVGSQPAPAKSCQIDDDCFEYCGSELAFCNPRNLCIC